ncbi:MAG: cobalt ECF transporter T component CbiQ [Actinomycetota bacterium]|nr:cobalt ECF transporter T component CbiQ [Actinomycetota bacterium]
MSGGHAHGLFVHRDSPVHRLAPQCKVLAAFLFVLAVVATPPEAFWAYGLYALLLAGVARRAQISPWWVAKRLLIETPFVLFALFLPLIGGGERVDVLGVSLSIDGLWGAWNILAKATLGLFTTVLLGATTPIAEILHGLEHLRMPRLFTAIAGFMVRYADVITGEVTRMRIARESRGYDPRWFWQARAIAASAGTLFIKSFERGERVYLAMVSRGYSGSMPLDHDPMVPLSRWAAALALPVLASMVSALAWMTR